MRIHSQLMIRLLNRSSRWAMKLHRWGVDDVCYYDWQVRSNQKEAIDDFEATLLSFPSGSVRQLRSRELRAMELQPRNLCCAGDIDLQDRRLVAGRDVDPGILKSSMCV